MSIHEQARAEAEKRYLVLEPGLNDITVGLSQATRNASKAFIEGFLAGHEAATRTRVVTTDPDAYRPVERFGAEGGRLLPARTGSVDTHTDTPGEDTRD